MTEYHSTTLYTPETLSPLEEQRLTAMVASMREPPYWSPSHPRRLLKAEQLYREGGIVPGAEGVFHVTASEESGQEQYTIHKTCPCRYSQDREDRWCAHRIAVALYRKLHHVPASDPDSTPDVPAALAMPAEAPVLLPPLPAHLTRRSITAIVADLSRPVRAAVAVKIVSGERISYLHWQTVARLLDAYAPGWTGEVTRLDHHGQTLRVTYRLTIPCAEGFDWREAIGEDDEWGDEEKNRFGNPAANAQANAFKRAAALFGVGQWLYDKPDDPTVAGLAEYFKQEKQAALIELGKALLAKGMDRKQALDWLKTKAGVTSVDQMPIVAIKTLLAHVLETPEVSADLRGYPDAFLTESEQRRLRESARAEEE